MMIYLFFLLVVMVTGPSYCEEPSRANLHYKKLKFICDGLYSQGFTDNVALSPTNEEWGGRAKMKAMLGLLLPVKKSETGLKVFGNLVLNGNQTYDVKSFSVLLAERLKLGQYLNIVSDGSLTRSSSFNPISDEIPVDIISGKVNCAAVIKSKKRISFVSKYTFTNEHDYNGSNYDDYRENSTLNTVWFSFTPKTAWLICYNFSNGKYLSDTLAEDNNTYSHIARTGLRFARIAKRLDGQFELGIRSSKSDLYDVPFDHSPLFFDVEGNFNSDFTKVKLGLTVDYGIRPTFGTNRIYAYQDTAVDPTQSLVYELNPFVSILGSKLTGSWNVVSKFFITASVAGERRKYPVGERNDNFIRQRYSLEWGLKKYFQFSLFYINTNNDSNVDRYTYVVNEPGIKISAKF